MPIGKVSNAKVRHTSITGKAPQSLSTLDNVCNAGAQCQQVQSSPIATQALGALQTSVTNAHGSLTKKQAAATALLAAAKALGLDLGTVKLALSSYEAVVNTIANGDASVINKSGLLSRSSKTLPTALGKVPVVHTKLGKLMAEAILSWPVGPGASSYALEVNFTPQTPAGPWVSLGNGTGRRRVVKAPAQGAQFLARVASVASDTSQSEWCDAILATAR